MSTATTPLAAKRNYNELYTSGRDDGVAGIHPGHTPYINLTDWSSGMTMGRPSALYENSYPTNVTSTWPRGECYFPSRWVWAHTEFTPRQTMRHKMALYSYLYGLAGATPPANPSLTVSTVSLAGGAGTVTSYPGGIDCGSDCSEAYTNGTTVTLTATPSSGSTFTGWSGACFGDNTTCELDMTWNRSVIATFQPEGLTYTLTVATDGTGSGVVTSSPSGIDCGSTCSAPFLDETDVTLTATADTGSTFTGWGGNCSGNGTCVVTMSVARLVSATFRSTNVSQLMIYDEALSSDWENWSWHGDTIIDFAATSPTRSGSTHVINATMDGWGALSLHYRTGEVDTYGYQSLKFWLHGGTGSNKELRFYSEGGGSSSSDVIVTAIAGTWTEITITMDELGNPASISRLNIQNNTSTTAGLVSFDDIRLEPTPTLLFEDGFETGDTRYWIKLATLTWSSFLP